MINTDLGSWQPTRPGSPWRVRCPVIFPALAAALSVLVITAAAVAIALLAGPAPARAQSPAPGTPVEPGTTGSAVPIVPGPTGSAPVVPTAPTGGGTGIAPTRAPVPPPRTAAPAPALPPTVPSHPPATRTAGPGGYGHQPARPDRIPPGGTAEQPRDPANGAGDDGSAGTRDAGTPSDAATTPAPGATGSGWPDPSGSVSPGAGPLGADSDGGTGGIGGIPAPGHSAPAGFTRSMVYSGLGGLGIAVWGSTLILRRRRGW